MEGLIVCLQVVLIVIAAALWKWLEGVMGSYASKSGEIRALSDNIAAIVDQQKQQTAATKQIETDLRSGAFVSEEKWRLKRDAWVGLLEWHAKNAARLRHHILRGDPSRYWAEAHSPEADMEYASLRSRAAVVFSEPMMQSLDRLERSLVALEIDKVIWKSDPSDHRRMLLLYFFDEDVQQLARKAGEDLHAILAADRRRLEEQTHQDNLARSAIEKDVRGEALSEEERLALDRVYAKRPRVLEEGSGQ